MENTLLLNTKESVATKTSSIAFTDKKKGRHLIIILFYSLFLATCLVLVFGQFFLTAVLLFVFGNLAFIGQFLYHLTKSKELELDISTTLLEQHLLEAELYDRAKRE